MRLGTFLLSGRSCIGFLLSVFNPGAIQKGRTGRDLV